MMLVVVLAMILACFRAQVCVPFGTRLSFGSMYFRQSDELLRVLFNTESPCQNSYVRMQQGFSVLDFSCTTKQLKITNTLTFTSYIHNCSINRFVPVQPIKYDVYGVNSTGGITRYGNQSITTQMADHRADVPIQFIVIADWGYIHTQPYTPLAQVFGKLISESKTDFQGVIMNGDYAYDLETNECQNYVEFLNMMSQISSVWPMIINTGNRESISENNFKIFVESFQLYNITTTQTQSILFKNFQIFLFDPASIVYGKSSDKQTKKYLEQIQAQLNGTNRPNTFRIAASHYPLMCSVKVPNCSKNQDALGSFFSLFNDQKFDLYIGSHVHTYQREYPIFKGKVQIVDGPYYNIEAMVSVVEGVAGNDKSIVEDKYSLKDFTVRATYNQTGFGVLSIYNATTMQYRHFSTHGGLHQFDSVIMGKSRKQQESLLRKQD